VSRRPSFQFYPNDWRTDLKLRMCSIGARGLWVDMMCLMNEGEPYGHLVLERGPVEPRELAKLVGESLGQVKRWLSELEHNGVFSRTDAGVIYSRRMVRDEHNRQVRAAGGHKSQEHPDVPKSKKPKGPQRTPERTVGRIPSPPSLGGSPSSSSSSSPSDEQKNPDANASEAGASVEKMTTAQLNALVAPAVRKHFWLTEKSDPPPTLLRDDADWTLGRELNIARGFVDRGECKPDELVGAITIARRVLGLPPDRPLSLKLFNVRDRHDRMQVCVAAWRKEESERQRNTSRRIGEQRPHAA